MEETVGHFSSRPTEQYWYSHRGVQVRVTTYRIERISITGILWNFLPFPLYSDLNNIIHLKMGFKTHLCIFHLQLLTDLYSILGLHLPHLNILAISQFLLIDNKKIWGSSLISLCNYVELRYCNKLFVQGHPSQIFTMSILKIKMFRRSLSDFIPYISF